MRVLVIGGTNFIGPHVVRRLVELGHEVTVFHRGTTEAELPPETKQKRGDRRRLEDHTEELQRHAPEIVLDMIPMNEHDARSVMRVFRGIAQRVVAISSQDVYRAYDILRRRHPGSPDPVPLTEDAPLREKLYPYDREGAEEYEKILVEKVVMGDPLLPGTVLRLPMVYGPGDYQHRLFPYLKRMDDGRPAIVPEEGMAGWQAGTEPQSKLQRIRCPRIYVSTATSPNTWLRTRTAYAGSSATKKRCPNTRQCRVPSSGKGPTRRITSTRQLSTTPSKMLSWLPEKELPNSNPRPRSMF